MSKANYIVRKPHVSSYPRPITFDKGAVLDVGEKYAGEEGWENWFWCHTHGQAPGWVPGDIIEMVDGESARALESYTAKELTVEVGQKLRALKTLNGWAWCESEAVGEAGWVPLVNLSPIES